MQLCSTLVSRIAQQLVHPVAELGKGQTVIRSSRSLLRPCNNKNKEV